MRNLVMEFVGTMFLVMAVGLTGNPIAIGVMLMVMIYVGGHVSGAHYNPAVSLAIWMRGKLDSKDLIPYMLAQVAGAAAGAFTVMFLTEKTFAPSPGEGVSFAQAFCSEALFTFVLASVVLNVATTKALDGNFIYGAAIGLTVTTAAFCAGGISGGAFNPAVGVGPILVQAVQGDGGFGDLLLYLIGPFFGGALAAGLFRFLQPEEI